MSNLKDKIIVVTGGSGLLGREMIKDIHGNEGTAINASIEVESDLENGNLFLDITKEESIDSCINQLLDRHGKIDGWVNNAYPRTADWGTPFEEIKPSSWRTNIDTQMNSCFVICQKLCQLFTEKKWPASIVNVASIYGIRGPDFNVYEGTKMTMPAAYSAIKGGVINFSRYLASYYGKKGIRVNCVSPGGIFNDQAPLFVDNYNKRVPLGRMGNPKEIAPAVSFLLSEDASYITGHNLVVDGGWTCI